MATRRRIFVVAVVGALLLVGIAPAAPRSGGEGGSVYTFPTLEARLGQGAALGRAVRPKEDSAIKTFILVVDGLQPELIHPLITPNLFMLMRGEFGGAATYSNAVASMVTETNTNHVGIISGQPPEVHGVTSNNFFNRVAGAQQSTARSDLVLAPTLIDAVESQKPWLKTAVVMGKERLRALFDCTRTASGECGPSSRNPEGTVVEHVRPDFFAGGAVNPLQVVADPHSNAPADPFFGATLDPFVMDQVIQLQKEESPDITFVNLPSVDSHQHMFGASSPGGIAAVRSADLQIRRLIDALTELGIWERSLMIVTADHSFSELNGTGDSVDLAGTRVANPVTGQVLGSRVILREVFTHPGILAMVTHGGSASIYLRDPSDTVLAAQLARQALELRDRIARPAVAGAFCRFPSDGCARIPSEWGLTTSRIGEVLLTADDQHMFLVNRVEALALLTGHHGGPTARPVPLILASGGLGVRTGAISRPVTTSDIAPTVAWVYGITGPDGEEPFPNNPDWSERLREAFSRHPK